MNRKDISDAHSRERKHCLVRSQISVPVPNICESCYLQLHQFMGE
jgi:hypothetical protein